MNPSPSLSIPPCYRSPGILLHAPRTRGPFPFLCSQSSSFSKDQGQTHNCKGLKFIRGKKQLKDLSTWGIGGPCNYFIQVFDQTQLVSAIRRRMSQPVGEQTAGSVFRNPLDMGVAAAELIEKAGLKGFRVGGAMVSKMHANFFINCGCSTSQDMLHLLAVVKEKVDQKFGVQLKEEIIYIHPEITDVDRNKDR